MDSVKRNYVPSDEGVFKISTAEYPSKKFLLDFSGFSVFKPVGLPKLNQARP
jgi:hypothetical protein